MYVLVHPVRMEEPVRVMACPPTIVTACLHSMVGTVKKEVSATTLYMYWRGIVGIEW